MKLKRLLKIFSLILIPGVAFGAVVDCPYFGGGKNLLNYPNETQGKELVEGIRGLIGNIIHFIKECLIKPALVGVIIWGGIHIMTSVGDPGKLEKGKKIILAGIIGLIIIFVAETVADFFSKYLAGPGPAPVPPPAPQTCAGIGYYCCTPDGCRGLNRNDLDSTCGAGQKCCQYPCCPNLNPGETCPSTCQDLCWCASGGKWIVPGQKCVAACESYSTADDCTGAGCKWCSKCSARKINKWGEDKCVEASEDCGYECSPICGAECGYVGPGSECTAGEGGFHCVNCDCVAAGPPGPCLRGDSLIVTLNGVKKIEELKEGDYVIGYKDGKKVQSKILEKSVHEGEFELYFYKGYWFTGNHLVYLDDYKELKPVSELSNIKIKYIGKVYNIKTETQNYFGENDLLIHNK